jgi:TPP-dependent indolepyruvate ferredoxin oxidoreductase alpha subunit
MVAVEVVGCLAVVSRAISARTLLVVAGTTPVATLHSRSLPDLIPEYVVYDPRVAPARGRVTLGSEASVLAAGLTGINRPRFICQDPFTFALEVVELAAAAAPKGSVATVDAGAHMLVAMPLWPADEPCSLLISSGLATMGFALPAAIAAALARPDRRVVCFTGDGGLGMALGELETLARLGSAVTVVVFDDASLSLIAAKQAPSGQGGEAATAYRTIDFATVARGCGLAAVRVSSADEYRAALRTAFDTPGPMLIDAVVDPSAYATVLDAIRGPRPATTTR